MSVGGDPELGEQVVDDRAAVGVQDLALDGADPQMLQRGVHRLGAQVGLFRPLQNKPGDGCHDADREEYPVERHWSPA